MDKTWPHAQLREYLKNEENGMNGKEGEMLRELLDMLDTVREGNEISEMTDELKIPLSFEDIDDLLSRFYAGNLSEEDKKLILNGLYHSEHFYQRIFLRMRQTVAVLEKDSLPSPDLVQIQSDAEILKNLGISAQAAEPDRPNITYKIPVEYWKKIQEKFGNISIKPRRLVYIIAGISILFIATLAGYRYYQTTYQINLAEDILKENYSIYKTGAPRLSGGYTSTGIDQLMGEDDKSLYIEKAMNLLAVAELHVSESADLKVVKARIFLIQNNLAEAQAIYERLEDEQIKRPDLLNDIGVLNFKLNNFAQARNYFQKVIELNNHFSEGFYNLALTEEKLGNEERAKELMNKYLDIEKDAGWLEAGRSFLK